LLLSQHGHFLHLKNGILVDRYAHDVFGPNVQSQFFDQHCYITGGSSGLGRALAILLTKKGADVTIVARDEERLAKALADIEVRPGSHL
jgi:5,10-methylene-tetrahydrofolate dehydrogenase/methenyl tetrahydrofolate cyclohydrolase